MNMPYQAVNSSSVSCSHCLDTVGWMTASKSGLWQTELSQSQRFLRERFALAGITSNDFGKTENDVQRKRNREEKSVEKYSHQSELLILMTRHCE